MKKFLFLVFIFLTWYLAAMYRLDAFMVFSVMELLLFAGMAVCVRYFKRKIQVTFPERRIIVNREEYVECPFLAENKGVLPVSRIKVRFSFVYEGGGKRKRASFSGNIDKKSTERMETELPAPFNGKLLVRIEKTEVYDYLSLFKARKKCREEMEMILLPRKLDVKLLTGLSEEEKTERISERLLRSAEAEEFIQLREYVQGDSYRHIHWKQSARTDLLWVKEYQENIQKRVGICLNLARYKEKSIGEISAFYEILWSVLLELLEQGFSVQTGWKDSKGREKKRTVEDESTAALTFAELYEKDWWKDEYSFRDIGNDTVFRFGLDLQLECGEDIFCFTQEHYEKELLQSAQGGEL